MGDSIQITLEVNDQGTATIRQVSGEFERMKRTVTDGAREQADALTTLRANWLGVTAAVYAAERALATAWSAVKRGAEFEETQGRLNRQLAAFGTTADVLLPKIQRLAQGQLSLEEASRLSSRALAAGILTPQQIGTFVQLAEILSDIKGGGVEESFAELQRGLMGVRSEALKALGIYVDLDQEIVAVARATRRHAEDISEEEKVLIRRNVVLRESSDVFKEHATSVSSGADKIQAFEKRWEDLTLTVSRGGKVVTMALLDPQLQIAPDAWVERVRANQERVAAINAKERAQSRQAAPEWLRNLMGWTPPAAPAGAPTAGDPNALAKLEQAQQQAIATAGRHASAVDDTTRALRDYDRAIELGKDLTQQLNQELTRQQSLLKSVREQLDVERDEQFGRGLRDLPPEEQLQKLRNKFNDLSTKDSPEVVEALKRIRSQVDGLGKTEGAEHLATIIQDRLVTVLERLERQSQAAQAQIGQQFADQTQKMREVSDEAARLAAEFTEGFQLKFSGDQELIDALKKIQEEARQVQREIANIRMPAPGGGGDSAPALGGNSVDVTGGFAEGTTRIPRTGLARLHYGEAVIPRDMNFLDPAIGALERESRLARLAAGQIPSFEIGTPNFGGGSRGQSLDFLADLPALRTGGRALFSGLPRDPARRMEFLADKLQEVEDSWNIFVHRVTGENTPHGSTTFFLKDAQWMTAFNSLQGLREQLSLMMQQTGVRGGGLGGSAERGLVIPVTVNVDGKQLVREVVIPNLREIAFG